MKNPNQLVRRIEAVRHQLERIQPPPKTAAELAEEEQLWERAWDLYYDGGVPRPDDDPRLFSYLDTITKYGPVFEDMTDRGVIPVPTNDDEESPPSRELASP
jgi:hypothetical protein